MTTRRTFLRTLFGGAAAATFARAQVDKPASQDDDLASAKAAQGAKAQRAAKPLRILILGGTGFLGPHLVENARARSHTLTLFNRGKTHPELFPEVEKLRGDRNGQLVQSISAAQAGRGRFITSRKSDPASNGRSTRTATPLSAQAGSSRFSASRTPTE